MDDTTRRVGGDRDDMIGRGEESTRNLDTSVTPDPPVVERPRAARAPRGRAGEPRRTASSAGMDRGADERTREIQAEIADTRDDMAETIDAIQEKLRPANLIAEAKEKVMTATTEKVTNMTDRASETAEGLMRHTRDAASGIVEGARQNPIPALMIGAGVAWLLMDRSKGRSNWKTDAYRQPDVSPSGDYYRSQQVAAGTAVDLDEWNDRDGGVKRMAQDARHTLQRSSRAAQNGFQRVLRQNPLLIGAAAMVAGAAVGAALPETERENEWLGEARDSVVDRAQQAARTAASTVKEVAGEAVEQVTDRVAPGQPKG